MYYGKFTPKKHSEKLYFDLFRSLTKTSVYDIKIKARCSKGFTVTNYFGSFGRIEANAINGSSFDSDKTFCFTLRNDE
jgi:hypothetical protein